MKAKWRKIIWVILAVQLLLLHLLFLDKVFGIYSLDFFISRAVRHFGLPSFLAVRWKQLVVLGWLATVCVILLIHYRNYRTFRCLCIGQIQMETEPFVMDFRRPILLLPEKKYSENVLKSIFLHECHHIRQKDTLYKLF